MVVGYSVTFAICLPQQVSAWSLADVQQGQAFS
jgi:hypothetical protein